MKPDPISHFWDKFILKSRNYGVNPKNARWYVIHAEQYINTYPDSRLKSHKASYIEKYLTRKHSAKNIEKWRYQQIVIALKIVFVDLIQVDWSKEFDWDKWYHKGNELTFNGKQDGRTLSQVELNYLKSSFEQKSDSTSGLFSKVHKKYPQYIENLIKSIRMAYYARNTETAYLNWIVRFISFNNLSEPSSYTEKEIISYLEYLVIKRKISVSTQKQALNALVYFYKNVLKKEITENLAFIKSKRPRRLPVVLSRDEILTLFENISHPTSKLMANIMYGCGLRLMECVRLRIMDIDFDYKQIVIRNSKGGKDRLVPLPGKLTEKLQSQVARVKELHQKDLLAGFGSVYIPEALKRKIPTAEKDFRWPLLHIPVLAALVHPCTSQYFSIVRNINCSPNR